MSIVRSPELGGLTDNRVRAAMFYSKRRRLERQRVDSLNTGTAPILATLSNGELLTANVTWTVPANMGFTSIARQMRLNSGRWNAFNISQVVNLGETWSVREFIQGPDGSSKVFTSNSREVTA